MRSEIRCIDIGMFVNVMVKQMAERDSFIFKKKIINSMCHIVCKFLTISSFIRNLCNVQLTWLIIIIMRLTIETHLMNAMASPFIDFFRL